MSLREERQVPIVWLEEQIEQEYRKKPVTVRARRMVEPFEVQTLEGTMRGEPGDWLITGIAGEMYPCKDEIFRATYDLVQEPT